MMSRLHVLRKLITVIHSRFLGYFPICNKLWSKINTWDVMVQSVEIHTLVQAIKFIHLITLKLIIHDDDAITINFLTRVTITFLFISYSISSSRAPHLLGSLPEEISLSNVESTANHLSRCMPNLSFKTHEDPLCEDRPRVKGYEWCAP